MGRPTSSSTCWSQVLRVQLGGRFQSVARGVPVKASMDRCNAGQCLVNDQRSNLRRIFCQIITVQDLGQTCAEHKQNKNQIKLKTVAPKPSNLNSPLAPEKRKSCADSMYLRSLGSSEVTSARKYDHVTWSHTFCFSWWFCLRGDGPIISYYCQS